MNLRERQEDCLLIPDGWVFNEIIKEQAGIILILLDALGDLHDQLMAGDKYMIAMARDIDKAIAKAEQV